MISNSGSDERGQYSGGQSGDQTGGEWIRKPWYSRPWSCVLRYPNRSAAGLIAQLAGEAADNNKIGYDQNQRITFWDHLKASNYFPSGITVSCEADCSAGVAAIVKAVGYILEISALKNVSADMYTGNERSALKSAGFEALTDSKYLSSDAYLVPGDILLYDGHHTAINLDWGGKATAMAVNAETFLNAVKNVYTTAHNGKYSYGDSKSTPPCADHVISCDRLIARALWDLGYTDQPKGGITVLNMLTYLPKFGANKITDTNALKAGDIVLMRDGSTTPNAAWHTFVVNSFTNANNISKYDMGSQQRINSSQPFSGVPLNEWGASKAFYCAFRFGGGGGSGVSSTGEYKFTPSAVKAGDKNASAYLATEILKARGYKAAINAETGKQQELELNFEWTIGDMAAMAQYKADRMKNRVKLNTAGCGEVSADDWRDLLGTFTAQELPAKEKKGLSVLLLQEILKSRGIKGKDGKELTLDQEWGPNVEHAVKTYQKARNLKQSGVVDCNMWRDLLGGL